MLCPTTHYDHIKRMRPEFVEAIETRMLDYPERNVGFRVDELDRPFFEEARDEALLGYFKRMIASHGRSVDSLTPSQVMSLIEPRVVLTYHAVFELEWTMFSNFGRFGHKTFMFSPNLTQKLADTELNLPGELLVPPFPSCMFVYDNQTARDAHAAIGGHPAATEGPVTVYLVYYEDEDGEKGLSTLSYQTDRKGNVGAASKRSLRLAEGYTIEDALRTDWLESGKARPTATASASDEQFFGSGLRMMRIIANSILYLASADPDISAGLREPPRTGGSTLSSKEKRKLERSVTPLDYTLVGRATTGYSGPPASVGKELTKRFKVRGHWRNQAHGPGRTERRFRHIEPFWKGPDAAEVINKTYVAR
jgi:hypothetical protein